MVSERGHGIHLRILQDFLNSSGAWGMGQGTEGDAEEMKIVFLHPRYLIS